MEDLTYTAHEIVKGRNLPLNLKRYESGMRRLYQALGLIKLAMNAWTVYVEDQDADGKTPSSARGNERYKTARNDLAAIIREGVIEEENRIDAIDELRNRLIREMEILTSFTEDFRVFEYVLNRVEYRFRDEQLDEKYYGYYLTNDLIHYIFQTKDNVAVNERIREVITQLPMRMSRQHFFETLEEAFSLYRGAQKGTIDDFADMIRDNGTLALPEGAEEHFPKFYQNLMTLESADYRNITAEQYADLSRILSETAEEITDISDEFVLLAQMTNDAYTVMLSRMLPESAELGEDAFARDLKRTAADAKNLLGQLMDPERAGLVGDEDFKPFEGAQERILMILEGAAFAVDSTVRDRRRQLEDLGELESLVILQACGKLQSGSDFVSLHDSDDKLTVPDDSYADAAFHDVKEVLAKQFAAVSQPVRRALMASVLAQLPVLFSNTDALQSYINVSLEQCSDTAERLAVVELLKEIMGYEMGGKNLSESEV